MVKKGQLRCPTPEQASELEARIRDLKAEQQQREQQAREETRRKEEERKAEIARKKQDALDAKTRTEQERKEAAAAAKHKLEELAREKLVREKAAQEKAAADKLAAVEAQRKVEAETKQKAENAKRAEDALLKSLQAEKERQHAAEADAKRADSEARAKVESTTKAAATKLKADAAQAIRDMDQKEHYIAQQKIITELTYKAQVISIIQQEISVAALKSAFLLTPIVGEYAGVVSVGGKTTLTYIAGKEAVKNLFESGFDKILQSKGYIASEENQNIVVRMISATPLPYPIQVIIKHEDLVAQKKQ